MGTYSFAGLEKLEDRTLLSGSHVLPTTFYLLNGDKIRVIGGVPFNSPDTPIASGEISRLSMVVVLGGDSLKIVNMGKPGEANKDRIVGDFFDVFGSDIKGMNIGRNNGFNVSANNLGKMNVNGNYTGIIDVMGSVEAINVKGNMHDSSISAEHIGKVKVGSIRDSSIHSLDSFKFVVSDPRTKLTIGNGVTYNRDGNDVSLTNPLARLYRVNDKIDVFSDGNLEHRLFYNGDNIYPNRHIY